MMCAVTGSSPAAAAVSASVPNGLPAPYASVLTVDAASAGAWDVAPGDSLTCTFEVTVNVNVPAGWTLSNYTDVDWSTRDGAAKDERVFDDTVIVDHDDDDDPDDNPNDDHDLEQTPVLEPAISKWLVSPEPGGETDDTPSPVRIGDTLTYQIEIPHARRRAGLRARLADRRHGLDPAAEHGS
jgi:hypothetical protein